MDNMTKYLGQMLDDRYELLDLIGRGGMSVVFKAMCHRLNRYVAIKLLRDELVEDEESRARIQAESQAIAMLSHPYIVSVYDVGHSENMEYIVMELLDGKTLEEYMDEKGVLPWKEALRYATQITEALAHAHSRGIVHRDIKPQNIMVMRDGNIKVADFGIAYLQSEMGTDASGTLGSVHYISPEQAKGLPVDDRTDVYSLGIVMYEMLTGLLPFDDEDELRIPLMHLSTVPTPIEELMPDVPKELIRITMKAMEPELEWRYQSAEELLEDLRAFRKTIAAGAGQEIAGNVTPLSNTGELTREQFIRRRRRARKVSLLSGFFAVMAFILFIAVFLWNYWLSDLFSVAKRIEIPNFVGNNYEDIINSSNYNSFRFTCVYTINPDVPEGVITAQTPEAGKSYMLTENGISVEISISTGVVMYEIPNYVNADYLEASNQLEKMGFKVDKIYENSDTITEGYVMSVNPAPGEKLPAGSTVYLVVSRGPEINTVVMPNLVGMTRAAAADKLESMELTLVEVFSSHSDTVPQGQIISQTIEAGLAVEKHTKVYLTVSLGPEAAG